MHIILLRFSKNKDKTSDHIEAHRQWLQKGFDDGLFLIAGTLKAGVGGGILAVSDNHDALVDFVHQDPFVIADVVTAEILEMEPARADERLNFLLS